MMAAESSLAVITQLGRWRLWIYITVKGCLLLRLELIQLYNGAIQGS